MSQPAPTVGSSAACRHALAALERLRHLAALDTLTIQGGADGDADDAWVNRVMGQIALDAHAGADFPLTTPTPDTNLVMTEGALRAPRPRRG